MARKFSGSQHIDMFIQSGGKCAICGKPLEPGWHADHVYPYSQGGPTVLENSQALCPECNLKKGNRLMNNLQSWSKELRTWQRDAFRRWTEMDQEDFLLVATPGAGKTAVGLRIAHHLLSVNAVERIVVVVPTDHLRGQWGRKANMYGLQLDYEWGNSKSAESPDMHGVVITYQQVASNPRINHFHCEQKRTCVIFDEIHHAGNDLSWGQALEYAFDPAIKRIGLSGTLFRRDNIPIPYVNYDEDQKSRPDFNYTYGDSLGDNICRPVFFPSYEGKMEWFSNGKEYHATFRDDIPADEERHRLNTALDANGNWLREVIRDADAKLTEVRENHLYAGGLIIAKDQRHAEQIADLMGDTIGQHPTVAISDIPDASDKINEFREGTSRWMVAVKMVSEGVDIPRLRVGVYATNIVSPLFFRQVVGRFVRMQPHIEEQNAYLYIPRIESLIAYAQEIKNERDHQLEEEIARELSGQSANTGQLSLYYSIHSEAIADEIIYDEMAFSPDEIALANQIKAQAGINSNLESAMLAKMLRIYDQVRPPIITEKETAQTTVRPPVQDQKKHKCKLIQKMVGRLHYDYNIEYSYIHALLNQMDGVSNIKQCTLDQLNKRIETLNEWIDKGLPSYVNQRS